MVTQDSQFGNTTGNPGGPPYINVQDSEPDAENIWGNPSTGGHAPNNTGTASTLQDVPETLRPGNSAMNPSYSQDEENPWDDAAADNSQSATNKSADMPADQVPKALRPGPARSETNPFKRKPLQAASPSHTSANRPAIPSEPANPPPPPPPTDAFAHLQVNESEQNTNPWQPALDEHKTSGATPPTHALFDQSADKNIWDSKTPSRQPSVGRTPDAGTAFSLQPEADSQPWDDARPKPSLPAMPAKSYEAGEMLDDQHAWDDLGSLNKGKGVAPSQVQMPPSTSEGWNLIDHETPADPALDSLSRQSSWENFHDPDEDPPKAESPRAAELLSTELPRREEPPSTRTDLPPPGEELPSTGTEMPPVRAESPPPREEPTSSTEEPPALPPRRSIEVPPRQPPRPQSPSNANKTETYQIKNINWLDPTAGRDPRKTPILVQNANGPCPLVALVNALTLTTPADQNSSNLVETLRSREQISLNFLLEAVIDELMSSRLPHSGAPLPDMSELYSFLKGLQTGMNVNPRFISSPDVTHASLIDVQPSEQGHYFPGTFEATRDMKLYATFAIPLIHGWIPPRDDPVYDALERQASSYDDAQTLLFREEELEDKLSNSDTGLTEQEQQLYQDVITIKSFLSTSATQLTPWGLEVITRAVQPGSVSILFRNDHFSTLYRHPRTQQLFTLVTDAGYYTHDEIVWESLVDVRGERSELFSGDFRPVGGPQHQHSGNGESNWVEDTNANDTGDGGGWQTVQSRRSRSNRDTEAPANPPVSPAHEQEDRDLALALQLQEEEEQRHRSEQAARRRESQLSEQYIEQQGRQPARGGSRSRGGSVSRGGGGPATPARGSSTNQSISIPVRGGGQAQGGGTGQRVRSLIPPANTTHRPSEDNGEEAPPSYEQASKATPYEPPAGHPNHPDSSLGAAATRRSSNQTTTSVAGPSTPMRPRLGAPSVSAGSPGPQSGGSKERDCIVM
ncbi:hypothetical protein F4780DRAFT_764769 [Xylariomycetidae sp. FL0641]|nr:hypothetical protein F4780DRAFT_764769 [Xylariomycetidae sp. FL0641]